MKTIAVTGSSGFIGKHLVKNLKKRDYQVIELDFDKGYDLLKNEDINQVPHFDTIVHLAAKSFVPKSFETPWEYYYVNYLTTVNVLEMARRFNAKVVYFSSYLYGTPQYLPIDEKHPIKPHNPYAQSKLICEKLCEGYNRDFNVPVIIFRPFNIYGKGQNRSFLVPRIIDQLEKGEITLKDSRPKRDFIHVKDVVKAVMLAIEYDKTKFDLFNLGYGKSYSIEEVIAIIKEVTNSNPKVIFTNEIRHGEILNTVASTAKLYNCFNWKPQVDLFNGIKHIKN